MKDAYEKIVMDEEEDCGTPVEAEAFNLLESRPLCVSASTSRHTETSNHNVYGSNVLGRSTMQYMNPNFTSNDSESPFKAEVFNMLESQPLYISAGTSRPTENSNNNVYEINNLRRSALHYMNPDFTRNGRLQVGEMNVKNYGTLDPNMASNSSPGGSRGSWQHFYQLGRGNGRRSTGEDMKFRDEDPRLMDSKTEMSNGHTNWLIEQARGDPNELSNRLMDGCNKTVSFNIPPKMPPPSNFTNFLPRRSLKGKGILCKGSETSMGNSFVIASQNSGKHNFMSRSDSDLLLESRQQGFVKGAPISYSKGISLREWLKAGSVKVDKVKRLHYFRQVVQLVDSAHSRGIILQDLWLSSFILLPSNDIIYDSSTQQELLAVINQHMSRKREFEQEKDIHNELGVKHQKLGVGNKQMDQLQHLGFLQGSNTEFMDGINPKSNDLHGFSCNNESTVIGNIGGKSLSIQMMPESYSVSIQSEKKWYACPEEINGGLQLSSNIYSLGILLFELLCCFESLEMHSAAMLDLRHRILPPMFLSEYPQEAGFCLWLLHPEPSCRPTAREILQSELICGTEEWSSKGVSLSCVDEGEDAESEILLDFLTSLKEQKQKHELELSENISCLENDIKDVEKKYVSRTNSALNKFEARLMRNIAQLESAYFYKRSQIRLSDIVCSKRTDVDLFRNCGTSSAGQAGDMDPIMKGKSVGCIDEFFEGICKFSRYSKFEVCGILRNGDLLNSANAICSLSFDRDEDYVAAAGVSKKIKIFEFLSLLKNSYDIIYPAVELSNESKLSSICWNKYLKNYLASADYDGFVQIWDVSTGQGISHYIEHQRRAWCVDFSSVDPMKFASGSDDCTVKLWSINEKSSTATISNAANICCVQFSPYSSNLLTFGSADYKIYCYDLRHTRIPWCTLAGHQKAVSYVKFLDSESVVSASTDNTLKLWCLKNTSLEGLSSDACSMTYRGHTNEKNFVGLSVMNGYIACGSETNEVYAYYRSLPMPVTSCKFGSVDPISGDETDDGNGQFISNVCWRGKSNMLLAANSSGAIKVLKML